jgi:hypothetical protein
MTNYDTTDIPQADNIWTVAQVSQAIKNGAITPEAIAFTLGYQSERTGWYYAHAARILGLVTIDPVTGCWQLTDTGQTFLSKNVQEQRLTLRRLMRQREPITSVIRALIARPGLTQTSIALVLQQYADLADDTALRRASTIIAWLRDLNLITSYGSDGWCYTGSPLR